MTKYHSVDSDSISMQLGAGPGVAGDKNTPCNLANIQLPQREGKWRFR